MAQFKGTVYVSTRMFTEQRFGADGLARVLGALTPPQREALAQITTVGWYPVEPVLAFHHALDRMFGRNDLSLCVEVGRFSAGWALNTILKFLLRFREPQWLVEKTSSVWGHYHDTGRWELDAPTEPRVLHGRLVDFAVHDAAFCARLRGWLMGAVELTGGKNPTISELRCTARGHECHEFHGHWE